MGATELFDSLNPNQKEALRIVEWLYFGERSSGRSYCIAVAAILHAYENEGEWVQIYDHIPTVHMVRSYLLPMIRGIINDDEELRDLPWEFQGDIFRVAPPEVIHRRVIDYGSDRLP